MTKEEIQKNSEHWYNKYKDAEKRIAELEKEKQGLKDYCDRYTKTILSLRQNVEELENKIADIKANCDLAIEGRDVRIMELEQENNKLLDVINNQDVKIAELEKGNAKLKADYKVLSCSVGDFDELQEKLEEEQRKNNGLSDQLTKAKDILRMIVYWKSDKKELLNFINKAEKLLKEIEK